MSAAIACVAIIGCLHKSLDRHGSSLLHRWQRLGFRFAVSLFFALFPLVGLRSSTAVLGVYAGTLALLLVAETIGKIGAVGEDTPLEGEEVDLGGESGHFRAGKKKFRRADLTAYEK
jgi:hypothetical protein